MKPPTHTIKTVFIDVPDEEFGFDRYEVNVDVWFVEEPEVDLAYVKDIWVNTIKKNGNEIDWDFKDPDLEVKQAIINELESML